MTGDTKMTQKYSLTFFNIIHERLITFETFCMVVLSDVWPLTIYIMSCVKLVKFLFKKCKLVKFLFKKCNVSFFLFSILYREATHIYF